MTRIERYRQAECPEAVRDQVVELMKLEWPATFRANEPEWPSEAIELDPVSIVLTADGVVLSHAAVLRKSIEHVGRRYLAFGVSAMVTAAGHRGQGFGRRVYGEATSYMRQEHADIGVFTCDESLRRFYEGDGWTASPGSPLVGGTKEKPFRSDHLGKITMVHLFSERARADRESIVSAPIRMELGEGKLW